ncbi:MAG TPA: hypothetical protein VN231_01640 [Allosphingosinicella sp.]|nr:hypothetical protein [Allosphingosinicella sp.]
MTDPFIRTARAAAIAGAALLAAACGGAGDGAANDAVANALDSDLMLDAPANDASAMESAANAGDPAPVAADNGSEETNAADPLGETSGGDTGGNTVDSNVSGM